MARTAISEAEALHKRPVELLQRLIRFDTSNPPGNERECIAYIDGLLRDAGLETTTRARDPERPERFWGQRASRPAPLVGKRSPGTNERRASCLTSPSVKNCRRARRPPSRSIGPS